MHLFTYPELLIRTLAVRTDRIDECAGNSFSDSGAIAGPGSAFPLGKANVSTNIAKAVIIPTAHLVVEFMVVYLVFRFASCMVAILPAKFMLSVCSFCDSCRCSARATDIPILKEAKAEYAKLK